MTLRWVALDEAVAMVMRGEVSNSIAIAGIMTAAEAVRTGRTRPVGDTFELRPTALAHRRQAEGFTGDMKKRHG
jgi:ADP-ribose pyrophosphatase